MSIPEMFSLFAHRRKGHDGNEYWHHVGTTEFFTKLHDKTPPVWRLEVRRVIDDESPDLWGWWEYGDDLRNQGLSMIYCKRMLLEMCFPYGLDAELARARGEPVGLVILVAGLITPITSNQLATR